MYAFRCKTCGHLHTSGHAGEAAHPHACCVCGSGVEFSRQGIKLLLPANWEVLHDATDARLAELGLARAEVCKHAPLPATGNRPPRMIAATASESIASQDRTG